MGRIEGRDSVRYTVSLASDRVVVLLTFYCYEITMSEMLTVHHVNHVFSGSWHYHCFALRASSFAWLRKVFKPLSSETESDQVTDPKIHRDIFFQKRNFCFINLSRERRDWESIHRPDDLLCCTGPTKLIFMTRWSQTWMLSVHRGWGSEGDEVIVGRSVHGEGRLRV
jgi:hypothetical protein